MLVAVAEFAGATPEEREGPSGGDSVPTAACRELTDGWSSSQAPRRRRHVRFCANFRRGQLIVNMASPAQRALGQGLYLIHFDRVGASRDDIRAAGRITFDRPVLGFVVHAKSLTDSDPWLGHPDTTYDSPGSRQILEMRFMRNRTGPVKSHTSGLFDEVHLGADGRSVEMVLFGGLAADQFRVLLAVEGN